MARQDPYRNFRFRLEIEGSVSAGFSQVSIGETATDILDYREGNEPGHVRKLPGLHKFGNVTLKHGMTASLEIFNWHKQILDGDTANARRNVAIIIADESGADQARFVVSNAWPAKYWVSDLNAKGNAESALIRGGTMAHETLLKMIVNGLQNLAVDQQTLFEHLNLRALVHGFDETFEGATYHPPIPPYPDNVTSQTQAADLVATIARNSALFVTYLGGQPVAPVHFVGTLDEADLLRLIIDWGTIQLGVQKTIVQLYGSQPAPPPGLPSPGASSEQRLWAEIVAWIQKIAADSTLLTEVQHFEIGVEPQGNGEPLVRMEQGAQETTLNLLQITGLLPYHLFHAACAVPPESSQAPPEGSVARSRRPQPRSPERKKRPRGRR